MPIVRTTSAVLKRILLVSITLVLLVGGISCTESQPKVSTVSIDEVEDGIFEIVNDVRIAEGLSVLSRSPHLENLAREYVDNRLSDEWGESSDIRYFLTNSWSVDYGGNTPQLTTDAADKQVAYCLKDPDMRDAMYRVEARATGIAIAIKGDTIYYTQVFDVVNAEGGDGQPIRLSENPEAANPSWEQLREFLKQDDTDVNVYEPGVFICGDFAETLHNNAEEAGIRAAYVLVGFGDGPGHALNAFSIEGETVFVDVISGDKVAYVEEGKSYGVIALDVVEEFTYSYFEEYAQDVEQYFQGLAAYNEQVEAYNNEVNDYNTHQPVPPEYDNRDEWSESLTAWLTDLEEWSEELEAKGEELGMTGQYWDPAGSLVGVDDPTVVSFYVHW